MRLVSPPNHCGDDPIGMTDGLRVIAWYLETNYPMWRAYFPLYTFQLFLGAQAVDQYAFYFMQPIIGAGADNPEIFFALQHQRRACAHMMTPNVAFCLLLVGMVFAALPAILHIALFTSKQIITLASEIVSAA